MADWVTISSLATAGGTLVLAVATFSSVRSANQSARVAERSLLAGLRPVLIPTHQDDRAEQVTFGDDVTLTLSGNGGAVERHHGVIYFGMGVRNGGSGLAVIHAWRARPREEANAAAPDVDEFRRQQIDLYIPAGDTGRWFGALRDPQESGNAEMTAALDAHDMVQIDLLYGDHEGGQRTIARFVLRPWREGEGDDEHVIGKRAVVMRYWNLDREDPR